MHVFSVKNPLPFVLKRTTYQAQLYDWWPYFWRENLARIALRTRIVKTKPRYCLPEGNSSALITAMSNFFLDILTSLSNVNNIAGPRKK
jgi:hypothetical protein